MKPVQASASRSLLLCLTWEIDTIVCPGNCDVTLGSVFKVTVLSEFVMEEGELVAEVVDPERQWLQVW